MFTRMLMNTWASIMIMIINNMVTRQFITYCFSTYFFTKKSYIQQAYILKLRCDGMSDDVI